MKTEPTEALRLLRETKHNPTHDIPKYKADIIARVAFSEGQSSPKIKQLEWEEYENRLGRKSYLSKTQFSSYEVADGGDHFTMFSPNRRLRFASADEAKAAAQADFEQRVRECLDLKARQKQALIDMMRGDEELGLYDNPKSWK